MSGIGDKIQSCLSVDWLSYSLVDVDSDYLDAGNSYSMAWEFYCELKKFLYFDLINDYFGGLRYVIGEVVDEWRR